MSGAELHLQSIESRRRRRRRSRPRRRRPPPPPLLPRPCRRPRAPWSQFLLCISLGFKIVCTATHSKVLHCVGKRLRGLLTGALVLACMHVFYSRNHAIPIHTMLCIRPSVMAGNKKQDFDSKSHAFFPDLFAYSFLISNLHAHNYNYTTI